MVHQVYIENNSKMIQLKEQYEKVKKWQPLGIAAFKEFGSMKSFFYFFLGFAVLILSANLGLPPLWGSEGRWAVIARSMLRSGDLLCPALGIEYYWDKPLLSYWQILPFVYINGGVNEFTARFPSVVWAVVMLFLTHNLAKRWFDEQTALLQVFCDEARALDWATQADGVLITSSGVSDQSWKCIVKGDNWQAVIPHKLPLSNDSSSSR